MRYQSLTNDSIESLRCYAKVMSLLDKKRDINKSSDSTRNKDAERLYRNRFSKSIVKYDNGVYIRHNTNMCL